LETIKTAAVASLVGSQVTTTKRKQKENKKKTKRKQKENKKKTKRKEKERKRAPNKNQKKQKSIEKNKKGDFSNG
jgi:hypothetical protein